MLQIHQVKCPNCGSPADTDDGNCNYCFARIPHVGEGGSGGLVAGLMFALVLGMLAAGWYLGLGLTEWVTELSGPAD